MISKYDFDELKARAFSLISETVNSWGPFIEEPAPEDVMNIITDMFYIQGIVHFVESTIDKVEKEEEEKNKCKETVDLITLSDDEIGEVEVEIDE